MDEFIAQSDFWDARADAWARHADAMEPFARQFGQPAIDRLDPGAGEHVADVGCGPGITTFELARRVGPTGSVVGIDVSARMVAAATGRAVSSGVRNVRFDVADPGSGPFGSFDAVHSRFGVMFFEDPVTAFRNVQRSIRPGGRFAAVVWAELESNPWMFVPTMFAAEPLRAALAVPASDEPGPFSLSDPAVTGELLVGCGFRDVEVVRLERTWNIDQATANESIAQMLSVGPLGEAWVTANDDARTTAVDAVRGACDGFRVDGGWQLPATALLYSARCADIGDRLERRR